MKSNNHTLHSSLQMVVPAELFAMTAYPGISRFEERNAYPVLSWMTHYATSRKVAGSIPDVIGFLQFT
jgi:hypothetical protein